MKTIVQLVFAFLLTTSVSQAASQTDFRLSNGMRVILVEDHRAPVVSYVLAYASGSIDDPVNSAGLAHFTEHLVLTRAGEAATRYEKAVEACGGVFNASTGRDAIRFYATVPAAQLLEVLSYEAERMKNPLFTAEGLETERKVVQQERAQGHDDKPYGLAEDYLDELAASQQDYKHPVIGYPANIRGYTLDDATRFIAAHYVPQNATLVLVGDISASHTAAQVKEIFGAVARRNASAPVRSEVASDNHGDFVTKENRGRRTRLYLAFPLPPRTSPDSARVVLLDNILVKSSHARLRSALVDTDIALGIDSDFDFRRDGGIYYLIVTLKSEKDAERAGTALNRVVQSIAAEGVSEQELRRARLSLRGDQAARAESSMERATQIALGAAVFGDPRILSTCCSTNRKLRRARCRRLPSNISPMIAESLWLPGPLPSKGVRRMLRGFLTTLLLAVCCAAQTQGSLDRLPDRESESWQTDCKPSWSKLREPCGPCCRSECRPAA